MDEHLRMKEYKADAVQMWMPYRLILQYSMQHHVPIPQWVRRYVLTFFFECSSEFTSTPPFRKDTFDFQERALDECWTDEQIEHESRFRETFIHWYVQQYYEQFLWLMTEANLDQDLDTISMEGKTYLHHFINAATYPSYHFPECQAVFRKIALYLVNRLRPWLNVDPEQHRIIDASFLCHDIALTEMLLEHGCELGEHLALNSDDWWTDNGPPYFPIEVRFYCESKKQYLHPEVVRLLRNTPLMNHEYNDMEREWMHRSDVVRGKRHYEHYENLRTIIKEMEVLDFIQTPFLPEP